MSLNQLNMGVSTVLKYTKNVTTEPKIKSHFKDVIFSEKSITYSREDKSSYKYNKTGFISTHICKSMSRS